MSDDDDHLRPSDFNLTEPCPPCYDGRAKEFLLFAAVVMAFALGLAVGMKIRDGQLRHRIEALQSEAP